MYDVQLYRCLMIDKIYCIHSLTVWTLYLSNVFCPVAFVHAVEKFSSGEYDIESSSSSFIIIAMIELGNQNIKQEDAHNEKQQPVDHYTQPAA